MSLRVYISSTYSDLVEQREQARHAVHKHELVAVGMETDAATDEPPVQECLADIRTCDIYVGIFAFRYGYMPDGFGGKSITQLEYEEATKMGIPRLIFVLDPSVAWTVDKIDGDRTRIDKFRDLLLTKHRSALITDPAKVGYSVYQALSKILSKKEGSPTTLHPKAVRDHQASSFQFPPLLPYLSNRSRQKDELTRLLSQEHIANLHKKPLVCIIHGNEQECHAQFIEKVEQKLLPDILSLKGVSITSKRIQWPTDTGRPAQQLTTYKENLTKKLAGTRKSDEASVLQTLNAFKEPLLLYSDTSTDDWGGNMEKLITEWVAFWDNLSELNAGRQLFVFLCIKHFENESKNKRFFFSESTYKKACRFFRRLDIENCSGLRGSVLPELKAIRRIELNNWIHDVAETYARDNTEVIAYMEAQLSKHYKKVSMDEIQMRPLVEERLSDLLEEIKDKYNISV